VFFQTESAGISLPEFSEGARIPRILNLSLFSD